jgi:hypothetical protein
MFHNLEEWVHTTIEAIINGLYENSNEFLRN